MLGKILFNSQKSSCAPEHLIMIKLFLFLLFFVVVSSAHPYDPAHYLHFIACVNCVWLQQFNYFIMFDVSLQQYNNNQISSLNAIKQLLCNRTKVSDPLKRTAASANRRSIPFSTKKNDAAFTSNDSNCRNSYPLLLQCRYV